MITQPRGLRFSLRDRQGGSFSRAYIIILCLSTIIVPVILEQFDYSPVQAFLAVVLLNICVYPTLSYINKNETAIPVLPLLCFAYALQFATPIFTQEAKFSIIFGYAYLDDADVINSLLLTILGVIVLQITYHLFQTRTVVKNVPKVALHLNTRKAEIYCIAIFALYLLLGNVERFLPKQTAAQFSSIIGFLQNQILIAIGIWGWIVFTGRGKRWHKWLLYCVVIGTAAIRGFSSTMLEQLLTPLIVFFIIKWLYTKRIPILGFVMVAFLILFLSPVKSDIRAQVAEDAQTEAEVSSVERAGRWIELSVKFWAEAFEGKRDFGESASDLSSRTDIIHQFAYIYAMTPSVVPYQLGSTYQYFAVAFIPRAIWPDKPQANGANNFFAVSYGITTEEGVKTSTFGVSLIGEGYLNFGIAGVILIMALQGIVLSLLETLFAGKHTGAGGKAIFLASFVFFLNGIGSSAEIMFGGLLQSMLLGIFLLWWARERPASVNQPDLGLVQSANKLPASP